MPETENLGEAAEHTEYETSCSLSWTISETHERPRADWGTRQDKPSALVIIAKRVP